MVKVIVQFRDKYDETRVFYPGDLLEIKDESRKAELLKRGLVEEVVPKVLKAVSEETGDDEDNESENIGNDEGELTVEEIKKKLDEKGIKYDKRLSKEKLVKLMEEAE